MYVCIREEYGQRNSLGEKERQRERPFTVERVSTRGRPGELGNSRANLLAEEEEEEVEEDVEDEE